MSDGVITPAGTGQFAEVSLLYAILWPRQVAITQTRNSIAVRRVYKATERQL
jgi:hypothetical protein